MKLSAVLRAILNCVFLTLTPSVLLGEEVEAHQNSLPTVLVELGYEQIEISGCEISFFVEARPSDNNNGLFGIWRYLDFDSLRNFSVSTPYQVESPRGPVFLIDLEFDDDYFERYRPVFLFKRWVRESYPEVQWPFGSPSNLDESSSRIEFELHRQILDVASLNREVFFTKFGPISAIESTTTTIAAADLGKLNLLRMAILEHARHQNCEIEE